MTDVREVTDENDFKEKLAAAGKKLVVVDFSASWCAPCQIVGDVFNAYPKQFPQAVFLRVDIDECTNLAIEEDVSALPTFIFYRNKKKIDVFLGANTSALLAKIRNLYKKADEQKVPPVPVQETDLLPLLDKTKCRSRNESSTFKLLDLLEGNSHLESDSGYRLILVLVFRSSVRISGFKMKAPLDQGPKEVRFFVNHTTDFLNFGEAESLFETEEYTLTKKNLQGELFGVASTEFSNVSTLQIFIRNNQDEFGKCVIQELGIYGGPAAQTSKKK